MPKSQGRVCRFNSQLRNLLSTWQKTFRVVNCLMCFDVGLLAFCLKKKQANQTTPALTLVAILTYNNSSRVECVLGWDSGIWWPLSWWRILGLSFGKVLGIINRDPSVSKSNWMHVVDLTDLSLLMWGIFSKFLLNDGLLSWSLDHYKETVPELTETCPNQDVINDKKLIENCPKWQKVDRKCLNWQ